MIVIIIYVIYRCPLSSITETISVLNRIMRSRIFNVIAKAPQASRKYKIFISFAYNKRKFQYNKIILIYLQSKIRMNATTTWSALRNHSLYTEEEYSSVVSKEEFNTVGYQEIEWIWRTRREASLPFLQLNRITTIKGKGRYMQSSLSKV